MPRNRSALKKSIPSRRADRLKFLDVTTGAPLAQFLHDRGFDALFVGGWKPSATDPEILRKAKDERRILISNDKDFGELVFKLQLPHTGVILLRLADESREAKQKIVTALVKRYGKRLPGNFVVASETSVRFDASLDLPAARNQRPATESLPSQNLF